MIIQKSAKTPIIHSAIANGKMLTHGSRILYATCSMTDCACVTGSLATTCYVGHLCRFARCPCPPTTRPRSHFHSRMRSVSDFLCAAVVRMTQINSLIVMKSRSSFARMAAPRVRTSTPRPPGDRRHRVPPPSRLDSLLHLSDSSMRSSQLRSPHGGDRWNSVVRWLLGVDGRQSPHAAVNGSPSPHPRPTEDHPARYHQQTFAAILL